MRTLGRLFINLVKPGGSSTGFRFLGFAAAVLLVAIPLVTSGQFVAALGAFALVVIMIGFALAAQHDDGGSDHLERRQQREWDARRRRREDP